MTQKKQSRKKKPVAKPAVKSAAKPRASKKQEVIDGVKAYRLHNMPVDVPCKALKRSIGMFEAGATLVKGDVGTIRVADTRVVLTEDQWKKSRARVVVDFDKLEATYSNIKQRMESARILLDKYKLQERVGK